MRTDFVFYVLTGPRVKLAGRESALTHLIPHSLPDGLFY